MYLSADFLYFKTQTVLLNILLYKNN